MIRIGNNVYAQDRWYKQAEIVPEKRIALSISNSLDIFRNETPAIIHRRQLPVSNFHELEVNVVDSNLKPRDKHTQEELYKYRFHLARSEENGRMITHQLDDLDKDGIWDELFLSPICNLIKPRSFMFID